MAKYSYAQLKEIWVRNGGNALFAPIAAAISLAESGGRSDAVSPTNPNGTVDQGLWQISQKGRNPALLDPNYNAKVAISMSKNGINWRPWTTAWTTQKYIGKDGKTHVRLVTYLGKAAAFWRFLEAGANVPNGTVSPGTPGTTTPSGSSGVSPGNSTDITKVQPISAVSPVSGNDSDCLLHYPSAGPVGGGCIINRGQARAALGVTTMATGLVVMVVGLGFLLGFEALETIGVNVGGVRVGGNKLRQQRPDKDDEQFLRWQEERESKIVQRRLKNSEVRHDGPAAPYRRTA